MKTEAVGKAIQARSCYDEALIAPLSVPKFGPTVVPFSGWVPSRQITHGKTVWEKLQRTKKLATIPQKQWLRVAPRDQGALRPLQGIQLYFSYRLEMAPSDRTGTDFVRLAIGWKVSPLNT